MKNFPILRINKHSLYKSPSYYDRFFRQLPGEQRKVLERIIKEGNNK